MKKNKCIADHIAARSTVVRPETSVFSSGTVLSGLVSVGIEPILALVRTFKFGLFITVLIICCAPAIKAQPAVQSAENQPGEIKVETGYPVHLFADTLFYVYNRLASLSPVERAANITTRLHKVFENDQVKPEDFVLQGNGHYMDISCGETVIMSVSEADAEREGVSNVDLAGQYTNKIRESFVKAREDRGIIKTLMRAGLVLLVLGGIYFVIRMIMKGHVWVENKITLNKEKLLKNLSYKDYTFLTADQELAVISWFLKIVKWFVIILLVYLLLPLVFSIFPFTRGWADTLFGFVWKPFSGIMKSVWEYLPNFFTILVIVFVFRYLIRFVSYVFSEIDAGKLKITGFHEDWAMPTFSIVKFLLYAFMFILIFPYLPGSDSGIFQGVSVFLGLLVSLGSSSAISNIVAGLVITYMRPFKDGDRIQIGDVSGVVIEKSLLVTRLRTLKNEEITIPNSSVLSGNTTNFSAVARTEGLIIHTTVTIGYDVPWREVQAALLESAARTSGLLTEKAPFVLQTSLDDFYVAYQLNVYTSLAEAVAPIYSELHQHIQDVFAEKGIEIMSPHYRAERDGNESTIPK